MADNELTPEIRFHNAEQYLIELLRLYRNLKILNYDHSTGGTVPVDAMYGVKREMQSAHLNFPFDEAHKKSDKIKKRNLSIRALSVFFHRALIEYKRAYAELMMQDEGYEGFARQLLDDAEARCEWLKEHFNDSETAKILPFYENVDLLSEYIPLDTQESSAIEILKEIGINQVTQGGDVKRILYELCIRGRDLDRSMMNVIVAISNDKEKTRKFLDDSLSDFHDFITKTRTEGKYFSFTEKAKYETRIEILENTIKRSERRNVKAERILERKSTVGTTFLKQMVFTESRFYNSFDFENEADRLEYIHWFELGHKRIKKSSIFMMHETWRFSSEAWDKFILLIEQHNAKFTEECDEETEEEIDSRD